MRSRPRPDVAAHGSRGRRLYRAPAGQPGLRAAARGRRRIEGPAGRGRAWRLQQERRLRRVGLVVVDGHRRPRLLGLPLPITPFFVVFDRRPTLLLPDLQAGRGDLGRLGCNRPRRRRMAPVASRRRVFVRCCRIPRNTSRKPPASRELNRGSIGRVHRSGVSLGNRRAGIFGSFGRGWPLKLGKAVAVEALAESLERARRSELKRFDSGRPLATRDAIVNIRTHSVRSEIFRLF